MEAPVEFDPIQNSGGRERDDVGAQSRHTRLSNQEGIGLEVVLSIDEGQER
ncbi:hypothetical protein A2U01_0096500, partial [Trifolium medium]|nr:hypothetical protein [Trifolium medium]